MREELRVRSYVVHMPGHLGSDGRVKPWVVKSHDDGRIIGSYASKAEAEKALKRMRYYKHAALKPPVPAEVLAKKWGVGLEVILVALEEGADVEMEHTGSRKEALQIASHHIDEKLSYYPDLKAMERSASWFRASGDSTFSHPAPDSSVDYEGMTPVEKTDHDHGEMSRTETDNHYDSQGASRDRAKKGKDSLAKEHMPYSEHGSTGWTDSMQPSSSPHGGTWDAPGSTAPEGINQGFEPSYITASQVCAVAAAPSRPWLKSGGLFNDFLDHAADTLINCRRGGLSRDAARAAVVKLHAPLFSRAAWMDGILNRFLDRAYGTSQVVKSPVESVESGISEIIMRAAGYATPAADVEGAIYEQYAPWIDNYPELRVVIARKLDAVYGARLASDSGIAKFKKITIIGSGRSGIVLEVKSSTPEATALSVYWLDGGAVEDLRVKDSEVVVREPSGEELRAATETADPPRPKAAALTVVHNPLNSYLSRLMAQRRLPVEYSEFRGWCAAQGISLENTYALERAAVAMNYVQVPDPVVRFSDKKVYVADDNSAAEVVDVDPAKPPEAIKTKEGKELKLKR